MRNMSELFSMIQQRFNLQSYEIHDTPGGVKIDTVADKVQQILTQIAGMGLAHSRPTSGYFSTVYIYPKGSRPELPPEQLEAMSNLKEILPEGTTIWTAVSHVASSGMSRHINLYIIKNNEPVNIDSWAAKALQYRQAKTGNEGVVVTGTGMDMGFSVVYNLGMRLYNNGYAFKQRWL